MLKKQIYNFGIKKERKREGERVEAWSWAHSQWSYYWTELIQHDLDL